MKAIKRFGNEIQQKTVQMDIKLSQILVDITRLSEQLRIDKWVFNYQKPTWFGKITQKFRLGARGDENHRGLGFNKVLEMQELYKKVLALKEQTHQLNHHTFEIDRLSPNDL